MYHVVSGPRCTMVGKLSPKSAWQRLRIDTHVQELRGMPTLSSFSSTQRKEKDVSFSHHHQHMYLSCTQRTHRRAAVKQTQTLTMAFKLCIQGVRFTLISHPTCAPKLCAIIAIRCNRLKVQHTSLLLHYFRSCPRRSWGNYCSSCQ